MSTALNVWCWSTTPTDNDDADSSLNWLEGQDPGTVNNSARGMMAALKKLANVLSGNVTVAGTADAITITTGQAISSGHQALGFRFAFKAGGTNTGATTVNVDTLGNVAVKRINGDALSAGDIVSGGIYDLVFDGTNYLLMGANTAAGLFGSLSGTNTWTGANVFQGNVTVGDDAADVVVIKGTTVHANMAALLSNATTAALRSAIGLGTAAVVNTGTSGATIPLLNTSNIFSVEQTSDVADPGSNCWYMRKAGDTNPNILLDMSGAAAGDRFITFTVASSGGTTRGSISVDASSGVDYNDSSDGRAKFNRVVMTDADDILDELNVYWFNWMKPDGPRDFGLVAQEVAASSMGFKVTQLGDGDPDKLPDDPGFEMAQLDYTHFVPLLVASRKAMKKQIDDLSADVAALAERTSKRG